jgi:transketolase
VLEEEGISVELINLHTIKPLDEEAILRSAAKTRAVVTAEEHQINGGLGDAVAGVLARNLPTAQEFVAVKDQFWRKWQAGGAPREIRFGRQRHHRCG